jgi:hypothetical protein
MNFGERITTFALIGLIVVGVGGLLGYTLVYQPLEQKWAAADRLEEEITDIQRKVQALVALKPRLQEMKRQSLPADINVAKAQYRLLLERLLQQARISEFKIPEVRILDSRPPVTPELVLPNPTPANPNGTIKKPAYTRLEYRITARRTNIWQIADFLQGFYRVDLAHQITAFRISRDNKPTESRSGLDFDVTIEAIILQLNKADERATLFPVPTAVGAVSGNLGIEAVARKPEVNRLLLPAPATPPLAKDRDYSYLALRDMFYGPLPPPRPPEPFVMSRLSDVTLSRDEKPATVRVWLSGEGAVGAKVVATASGSLLPEGELPVDPKTYVITIPGVPEDTPESATATVTVVATSADGSKTQKGSFRVTVARKKEEPPPPAPKVDVSAAIRLIGITSDSNGTMTAIIKDAAAPYRYELVAGSKKVEVVKWWQATNKIWKKDLDYDQPAGVLLISDDYSATRRTFKVIAIEDDAVILSETPKVEAATSDSKAPAAPGGGFRTPGGGFRTPGGPSSPVAVRQGPVTPLAALTGNPITAIPTPTLYRWPIGKSLLELKPLDAAEARTVLRQVAAHGPLAGTSFTSNGRN